jgi:hypothetical protein
MQGQEFILKLVLSEFFEFVVMLLVLKERKENASLVPCLLNTAYFKFILFFS